ncbi:putative LRR receptor-like serine/threonine-protein kinase [Nymphaea thermarum]|nr:putative LRR receptor-like serine/threonine-protein kinase [Nymphaea thermarum]
MLKSMPLRHRHLLLFLLLPFFFFIFNISAKNLSDYCPETRCGSLIVNYPFYLESTVPFSSQSICGYEGFGINCSTGYPILTLPTDVYLLKSTDYNSKKLALVDTEIDFNPCPAPGHNVSLDPNSTLKFDSQPVPFLQRLPLPIINCLSNQYYRSYVLPPDKASVSAQWLPVCNRSVEVPLISGVGSIPDNGNFPMAVKSGFMLDWSPPADCSGCEATKGCCGRNTTTGRFISLCNDVLHDKNCNDDPSYVHLYSFLAIHVILQEAQANGKPKQLRSSHDEPVLDLSVKAPHQLSLPSPNLQPAKLCQSKILLYISEWLALKICKELNIALNIKTKTSRQTNLNMSRHSSFRRHFLLVCLFFCLTRSRSLFQPHPPVKVEQFLLDYQTLTTTRYTYNDIIKMTKKFKHKVGQGGYGSVFQGWLSNGTIVAVKLIQKSHNDREEFCNEVATIGRIHHVNVVRLLGFWVEGSRRALIYEFMANGSLEKFTNTTDVGHCVLRENLYDIALGIARGIEYLDQGCDQRIIHFDIKPHNILLDHDFTPKISDFGLAKSYSKDRNSVTIREGKGTIGYIAPELFYGNSKHVSHKSDVYSFGMLLIAMVGLKEKIGAADGSSSEAYFSQWIHDTISNDQKFEGIGEDEDEMVRKVATIALWCIQWSPIDRPCMKEVIRMFESCTSNLIIPPKHFCPAIQPDYMIEAIDSSSTYSAADSPDFAACAPASCNGIDVNYPFSLSASTPDTSCAFPGLNLTCQGDKANALLFLNTPTGLKLIVKNINYTTQTIKLAIDRSLMLDIHGRCFRPSRNITLSNITNDHLPLRFTTNYRSVILFYGCSTKPSDTGGFDPHLGYIPGQNNTVSVCSNPASTIYSYAFSTDDYLYEGFRWFNFCLARVSFPILAPSFSSDFSDISLSDEFDLVWVVESMTLCADCTASGGRCGYSTIGNGFLCFCRQGSRYGKCNRLAAAVGSFLLACLLFCARSLWISRATTSPAESSFFQLHTPAKLEKLLLDYKTLTATRYTYSDIMKMTNKFESKLGQGGYGSVFQGWLSNGKPVAVKLMEKSYKDGEEFCNEVATVGMIHHVNVVRLLGFCVEGSRRVLVYEFMLNGSLEKITNTIIAGRCMFRPERLYDIALGIARGIEYLHQGCDQRIIHFDIKPHNILLDHDYTPKISDFGLAKSYSKERSTVTITQGKGTVGYVAPEVFYGNSRHVSHKSDVYSFGMLLIAMLGMKEKIGTTGACSSGPYFPQWIHDTLLKNQNFEGIEEGQDEIIRKVTTIALWCMQWNPLDRPCMKEVVKMFESSTSNLTMPPNRFYPAIEHEFMSRVLAAAVGSFLLACLLFFITRSLWISSSRRFSALNGCLQLHTTTKVEKFVMDYKPLTATRYTYNDIMKMTSKFKYKIGQGGYGSVYKGWLTNSTPVAVKLMEKSYNDGEEFCNEVATIGRIHHVNVVRLLGFCVEGSRRALVYEFMANGSLEKFINTSTIADHRLSRERLYGIALGIARGIEYLHQGCDRRIIHFDIKPHNILLDLDFTPKISDFGLAKSHGRERSIVTITDGKGTIGYIAPEVFYDNSRHASHKSDVYSFGMLLLSVVGMKENFGGSSSEAYFPYWIHETLSKNQECHGIREGEDGMVRKMATVALWCIQWNPNDRPCMKDIVRMLEGSTTNLTMPPNRFFPATEPEHMIQGIGSSSISE